MSRRSGRTYVGRSVFRMGLENLAELSQFLKASRQGLEAVQAGRKLSGSKSGQVALVLANGPSLELLDPASVIADNPDVFVVNGYYKFDLAQKLMPTYYTLSDPYFFSDNGPSWVSENIEALTDYLSLTKPIALLPHWAHSARLRSRVPHIPTAYFDDRQLAAWTTSTSPLKARGYLSLTAYKALAYAIFLGYSQIFILGFDNTEFLGLRQHIDGRLVLRSNHAHGVSIIRDHDLTPHAPDGPAGFFEIWAKHFGDLHRFHGPITNLDRASLTDAFPRAAHHPWIREDGETR